MNFCVLLCFAFRKTRSHTLRKCQCCIQFHHLLWHFQTDSMPADEKKTSFSQCAFNELILDFERHRMIVNHLAVNTIVFVLSLCQTFVALFRLAGRNQIAIQQNNTFDSFCVNLLPENCWLMTVSSVKSKSYVFRKNFLKFETKSSEGFASLPNEWQLTAYVGIQIE